MALQSSGSISILEIAADDDLQITHSGSVGDITCSTGALDINAGTVNIKDEASSETMASFVSDGAVTLNHDNTARLATTSAGVSVTGTLAVSSTSAFTGALTASAGVGGDVSDPPLVPLVNGVALPMNR